MNSRRKEKRLVTLQTLTNNYVAHTCAELIHTVKDTGKPWGGGGGRGWGEEAVEEGGGAGQEGGQDGSK